MTIPRELQRSTPRQVSLTFPGKAAIVSFCLLLAAFIAEIVWVYPHAGNDRGLPGMVGAIGVYILFAIAINLWSIPRQMRLLSCGRAAVAHTTGEFRRVKFTGRRIRRYRLRCEFTLLNGALSRTTVEVRGQVPAANTEIVIVYDPDQPENAMLYPARILKVDGG